MGFKIEKGIVSKGEKYKLYFVQFNAEHVINDSVLFKTKRDVQRILGFVNWYGLFVPGLSTLIEPFRALLAKNPPYVVHGAEKLYKLQDAIKLDIKLTQPISNFPFYIFIKTNDLNLAGCIYQRDSEGRVFVITMMNHAYKDQILAKEPDVKKLYSFYYVVKRYKDLLFGHELKFSKHFEVILSWHKESAYLSPLLGKWLVFLNCFVTSYEEDQLQPKCLIDFLTKYHIIPGTLESQSPREPFVDDSIAAAEEWPNKCLAVATAPPIALKDTQYAQTIQTILRNIREHQDNDEFCQKIKRSLDKDADPDKTPQFSVEEAKLYKNFDDYKLLVLPQHAQMDVILTLHEIYLHPGVQKTLAIVQQHF